MIFSISEELDFYNNLNSPCFSPLRRTVDTTRIKPFSTYVCTEQIFDSSPFMFFEKTCIEVVSSHLYASFGTFYVQIGQSFEAQ